MHARFAILSALLRYPDATVIAALPEISAAIPTAGFGRRHGPALARLTRRLAAGDPLDRQEDYVRLFDRSRTTSLHLFEHVHGDGRQRGAALVELARLYDAHGLALAAHELPDYLPLLLEFLAHAPPAVTRDVMGQAAPILDRLHGALLARGRPAARAYAAVIAAALDEVGVVPTHRPPAEAAREDEDDLAAIDRAWEDAPVIFGPEADPCGTAAARP